MFLQVYCILRVSVIPCSYTILCISMFHAAPPPWNTERMSYGLDKDRTTFFCIGRMLKTHEHERVIWIHTNDNRDVHKSIMDNRSMLEYCQRMNVLYIPGYPPHVSPSGLNKPSEGTDTLQIQVTLSRHASSLQAPKPLDMRGLMRKLRMWKGTGLHMNLNVSSMKMSLREMLSMIPGATSNLVRAAATLHPDQVCIEKDVAGDDNKTFVLVILSHIF